MRLCFQDEMLCHLDELRARAGTGAGACRSDGQRVGGRPAVSTFLGTNVWVGTRCAVASGELPAGSSLGSRRHRVPIHPFPRDLRRRKRAVSRLQLFVCGPDLRWPSRKWHQAVHRAELYAARTRGLRHSACLLVQAAAQPSEIVREVGRTGLPVYAAPGGALRSA